MVCSWEHWNARSKLHTLVCAIIAKWEARQLIVVQGSQISASVYLFVCLCVTPRNARVPANSWWRLSSRNVLYYLFCYVNAPSSDLLKFRYIAMSLYNISCVFLGAKAVDTNQSLWVMHAAKRNLPEAPVNIADIGVQCHWRPREVICVAWLGWNLGLGPIWNAGQLLEFTKSFQ